MTAAEELLELERRLDGRIPSLPAASAPARSLIARVHLVLDRLFNGSRPELTGSDPALGEALGVRLFGLLPVLETLQAQVQATCQQALADYDLIDPSGAQMDLLLAYCQLWEIVPEVRRDYFRVTGNMTGGLILAHPSPDFAEFEVRDSFLMALTEPALLAQPGMDEGVELLVEEIESSRAGGIAPGRAIRTLAAYYEQAVDEEPLLGDEGLQAAAGVTRSELKRFRGACLALAHAGTAYANLLCSRYQRGEVGEEDLGRCLDWLSQSWIRDELVRWVSGCAEIAAEICERLLDHFSLRLDESRKTWPEVRDGYLPPFLCVEDRVMISPELLRLSLLERNLLSTMRWRRPDDFHELVSRHLEPALLDCVEPWFTRLDGATVRREVDWDGGEIDLLVYDERAAVALHVQAKAAIPPNGARMTAALESRMKEGLAQHRRFATLAPEKRTAILGKALGRTRQPPFPRSSAELSTG